MPGGLALLSAVSVDVTAWARERASSRSPKTTIALTISFVGVGLAVLVLGTLFLEYGQQFLLIPAGLVVLSMVGRMTEVWIRARASGRSPGTASAPDAGFVGPGLAVLALGLLYLGGVAWLLNYQGHGMFTGLAVALAPLMLLAALCAAIPTFVQQRAVVGGTHQGVYTASALQVPSPASAGG
jgi:hypothetical protein